MGCDLAPGQWSSVVWMISETPMTRRKSPQICKIKLDSCFTKADQCWNVFGEVVGGDWNVTWIFPFSWESSSQLTNIVQRGWNQFISIIPMNFPFSFHDIPISRRLQGSSLSPRASHCAVHRSQAQLGNRCWAMESTGLSTHKAMESLGNYRNIWVSWDLYCRMGLNWISMDFDGMNDGITGDFMGFLM